MNTVEFDKIVKNRMSQIEQTLTSKSIEYSTEDRLHSFKAAARIDNITPKRALWGMFMKHFVSIQDMVFNVREPNLAMIDEKIGDAINYLVLAEAIMKEELLNKKEGTL